MAVEGMDLALSGVVSTAILSWVFAGVKHNRDTLVFRFAESARFHTCYLFQALRSSTVVLVGSRHLNAKHYMLLHKFVVRGLWIQNYVHTATFDKALG